MVVTLIVEERRDHSFELVIGREEERGRDPLLFPFPGIPHSDSLETLVFLERVRWETCFPPCLISY